MAARSETIAMRDGEKIAAGALQEYLRGKLDGAERGVDAGTVSQRPFESDVPAARREIASMSSDARRSGPVAPKAHDMVREYHVLRAVHPHFPPAPRPYVVVRGSRGAGRAILHHGAAARRRSA